MTTPDPLPARPPGISLMPGFFFFNVRKFINFFLLFIYFRIFFKKCFGVLLCLSRLRTHHNVYEDVGLIPGLSVG